ncbi:hypothetical protein SODG_002891 [Sodalis praecaptivus]
MSNIPAPECFCWRVADAYMYHLMATNRRPVYRYQAGDIEVCRYFLCGFLDDHLSKISPPKRAAFCLRLLEPFTLAPDPRAIICGGKAPMLNRRGIRYMNALMHQYGDTLMDVGIKDERGVLVLPPESEWANLKFSDVVFE